MTWAWRAPLVAWALVTAVLVIGFEGGLHLIGFLSLVIFFLVVLALDLSRVWQRKWYFALPVAVVFAAGVYFAAAGRWPEAALYFTVALFYAALERRRWQRADAARATRR